MIGLALFVAMAAAAGAFVVLAVATGFVGRGILEADEG